MKKKTKYVESDYYVDINENGALWLRKSMKQESHES
jgi:hypothetical protein